MEFEEAFQIAQIRLLLRPEIRLNLIGVQINETGHLISLAIEIEHTLREVRPSAPMLRREPPFRNNDGPSPLTGNRVLS